MDGCLVFICRTGEQRDRADIIARMLRARFANFTIHLCGTGDGAIEETMRKLRASGCSRFLVQPLVCFSGNEDAREYSRLLLGLEPEEGEEVTLLDPLFDDAGAADRIENSIRMHVPSVNRFTPVEPGEIQKRSFAIIDLSLPGEFRDSLEKRIVVRAVHATADLSIAARFFFSDGAVRAGIEAIRNGAPVVTDVSMIAAGIGRLFGGRTLCAVSDRETAELARRLGITRSAAGLERLKGSLEGSLVVIGNAPTALVHLLRIVKEEGIRPALTVGVPVGFVGAAESKELLVHSGEPCIALRGNRGGSTVAAAVVNALGAAAEGNP